MVKGPEQRHSRPTESLTKNACYQKSSRISFSRKRRLWELISAPPSPPHPNLPSSRFNHFLGLQCAKRPESLHCRTSTSTLTHPTSPFLSPSPRGTYFSSTSSVPKMDSSPSTLRIMARGIYKTVIPTGLRPRPRPRLPIHRRPLSSGIYSSFRPDARFKS